MAEFMQSIFPPFPDVNYKPDFTAYDALAAKMKVNWEQLYTECSQSAAEAIWAVGDWLRVC
jgi:hypothetical protein